MITPALNPTTGEIQLVDDSSDKVPYTGATADVDLGGRNLTCNAITAGSVITGTSVVGYPEYAAWRSTMTELFSGPESLDIYPTGSAVGTPMIVHADLQADNLSGTNTGDQDLSGLVPYSGATQDVSLGSNELSAANYKNVTEYVTTCTNFSTSPYIRLGRVPIATAQKDAIVKIRAVTAAGTVTTVILFVNIAYRADLATSTSASIQSSTAHSYNSDTTAENGYVLRYARISSDGTYWNLDVQKYVSNTLTIQTIPQCSNEWEWFTGDISTDRAAGSYAKSTLLAQGLRGDNISANYASYATYSQYGVLAGQSLSDSTDKTGQWAYIGEMYLAYNSTYRYGQSANIGLDVKELTDGYYDYVTADNLCEFKLNFVVSMPVVASSTAFNAEIPAIELRYSGGTTLGSSDFAALVFSTSTSTKYVRLYIKLKSANTQYQVLPENRYGLSYSSTGANSTSYCYFNYQSNQTPVASLPTPAQGSVIYGVDGNREIPAIGTYSQMIWGERSAITTDAFFGMGNGQTPTGLVMAKAGQITGITCMTSGTIGTSGTVYATVNGVKTAAYLTVSTTLNQAVRVTAPTDFTAISFSAGDILNLQCGTVVGTWAETVAGLEVTYSFDGLKGDAGSVSAASDIMLTEVASTATPSAGVLKLYAKTDDKLYSKTSAGVENRYYSKTEVDALLAALPVQTADIDMNSHNIVNCIGLSNVSGTLNISSSYTSVSGYYLNLSAATMSLSAGFIDISRIPSCSSCGGLYVSSCNVLMRA